MKLRALLAAGIRHFINLVEEDEVNYAGQSFVPYEERLGELANEIGAVVICTRQSIRDMDVPTREICAPSLIPSTRRLTKVARCMCTAGAESVVPVLWSGVSWHVTAWPLAMRCYRRFKHCAVMSNWPIALHPKHHASVT